MNGFIHTIIIKAVSFCNLSCIYCSAHCGEHKPQQIEPDCILSVFKELVAGKRIASVCKILWHGGEPTLYDPKVADMLMSQLLFIAGENGIELHFAMQTNGFIISSKWLDLIRKYDINMGVSCDGPCEINDKCRKVSDGSGTYERVINTINALLHQGSSVSLLSVIDSRQENDIKGYYDWCATLKMPIKLNPLFYDRINAVDFQKYYDFLREFLIVYLHGEDDFPVEPFSAFFQAILSNSSVNECSFSGNCGKHILCINYSGEMSACGRLTDVPQFIYPVVPGRVLDIFNKIQCQMTQIMEKRFQVLHCEQCSCFKFCHAGCNSYLNEKNISQYCHEFKKFYNFMSGEALLLLKKRLLKERGIIQNRIKQLRLGRGL